MIVLVVTTPEKVRNRIVAARCTHCSGTDPVDEGILTIPVSLLQQTDQTIDEFVDHYNESRP